MVEGMQIEGEPAKRGPGRPSIRAEVARQPVRDSVREAEEYAAKLIEELGDQHYNADEFFIAPEEIPEGWSYQWKSSAVVGKENIYHMLELQRGGWRPVPTERHPYKMPAGTPGSSPITIKGLTLMELPKVLTDKAERAHIRESREALRNSEAQLYDTPANTAPRDDPSVTKAGLNKVTRDYVNPRKSRGDD